MGFIHLPGVQEDVTGVNAIKKAVLLFSFIVLLKPSLFFTQSISATVITGNNSARVQFSGIYALQIIKRFACIACLPANWAAAGLLRFFTLNEGMLSSKTSFKDAHKKGCGSSKFTLLVIH